MGGMYSVEFSDNNGEWPPVKSFNTSNYVVADLFDGYPLNDVRRRIAEVQLACAVMLSKLEEWNVP